MFTQLRNMTTIPSDYGFYKTLKTKENLPCVKVFLADIAPKVR
jgi:hypothetical protein